MFRGLIILSVLLLSTPSWGQASKKYSSEYANFYRAEELFEKEQYSAARKVFDEFINEFKDPQDPKFIKAKYYRGISALELYNSDAVKLLMEFNNEYPESIYSNEIYFKIGEHFYQSKKYKDAKEWFDRTDPSGIDTASVAAYHFKLGYSNFQLGKLSAARNHFYDIKDGTSNYSAPALYYYSYILYKDKSYKDALDGFLKLEDNPAFSKEVPYYITQIYYLIGDYEKVTEYAPNYNAENQDLSKTPAEMSLLIGDAFYRVGNYKEAVPYLEDYNQKKETTREEDYALAYSYYKDEQYDKAIKIFDRISRTKDNLGQISYYHIAQSYLKKEELNYARSAFKSAAELDYDAKLQEDALYNYAVLSYRLDYNPYNEAIKAFELFLREFPESERKEDVYSYMVNVYLSTKNYAAALSSLNRIPELNIKLKAAYQVVSFNMGIEKYERGDYNGAIQAFKEVTKYDVSSEITGKAKFWTADSYYMLANWNLAVKEYRAFLLVPGISNQNLKESAYYNIGYAYFNQEDWVQAIQAFRTFTQLQSIQDDSKLADAYTRIGDSYFTQKNPDFQKSALNYEQALNYNIDKKDKILYSLSRVYRLTPGKREAQITTLQKIINNYPQSSYYIPAIFDVALGYKYSGNYQSALTSFSRIVNEFSTNILVKDALIEIGDIKYKQQNYTEAESYFKRVLNEFSLDDETCKRVTKGIIDVYRVMRRQDEIVSLGKQYPCAEITKDDEEVFYYETAIQLYMNEEYDEAIPEINKYLLHYPNGRFSVQLLSYLAGIYYDKGDEDKALTYYKQIIERPNSTYTEEALVRASKILYNNKDYSAALPYYKSLETLTSNPKILFNTRVGLMRTNYLLENYSDAAKAAEKVLKDKLLEEETVRIEGNYIAGMSNFKVEKYQNAITYLRWTADNTGQERGTEALYYLTETYFFLQDYTQAEKLHNELLKRTPVYDFWIAKSLMLQAKVFMVTDDLFQAEQTINLVLDNYPNQTDGILDDAEQIKAEIMQLKMQPKSIQQEGERTIDLNEDEEGEEDIDLNNEEDDDE